MTPKSICLPALLIVSVICASAVSGCRKDKRSEAPPPPRQWNEPVDQELRYLRELALNVQVAADPREEAAAIRRLQEHMRRNGMTYTVNAYRVNEDRRVASPSTQTFPVRAIVEIFRAREKLHTFVFIPRQNQNLALLIA